MIAIWAKSVFLLFLVSTQIYFSVFSLFLQQRKSLKLFALGFLIVKCITLWHSIEECACASMLVMSTSKNCLWLFDFSSHIFRKLCMYLSLSLNQKYFEAGSMSFSFWIWYRVGTQYIFVELINYFLWRFSQKH